MSIDGHDYGQIPCIESVAGSYYAAAKKKAHVITTRAFFRIDY